jgi:hypothetical protein
MIAPHMVRFIPQTGEHGDCGVATLGSLLGKTYAEVLIAAAKVRPNVLKVGLHWKDFVKVGKRLGFALEVVKVTDPDDLEEATGILGLKRMNPNHDAPQLTEEHVVYLWHGRPIDGNNDHWLYVSDYVKTYNYDITGLLVIKGQPQGDE